jgi:small nuclear ribonucleoprotein E
LNDSFGTKIRGRVVGFDEFMNLVLVDAEQSMAKNSLCTVLGTVLIKGENIILISQKKYK